VDESKPLIADIGIQFFTAYVNKKSVLTHDLRQGLTLLHFSPQLEPCLTHKNTLHTLNTPLKRATQPLCAPPTPLKALNLSCEVSECTPLP